MASEREFELLDDYIANRLKGPQRAKFEQQLAGDKTLSNQLSFEQRIAEGIRDARKAELKSMLNNIPVASTHAAQTSVMAKVAGLAVVTALGISGYFYFSDKEENVTTQEQIVPETNNESVAPETPTSQPQPETIPPVADDSKEKSQEKSLNNNTQEPKTDTPVKEEAEVSEVETTSQKAEEPVMNVFDPSEENETSEVVASEDLNTEEQTPANSSSLIVETDNNNKKYSFHYQFKEGKLFLYGSFERNLYEIMEFFADNKRTVFLFYKNNYYLLDETNEKVKPLAPINDPALLKKLKEFRENKQ